MENKELYMSPRLTVVTFHVEKGFTVSETYSAPMNFDLTLFEQNNGSEYNRAVSFTSEEWSW